MKAIDILQSSYEDLLKRFPFAQDFFSACGLHPASPKELIGDLMNRPDPLRLETLGFDQGQLPQRLTDFINQMDRLRQETTSRVETITILGGRDKTGNREILDLELRKGEIHCVVGPTGAGKSMLLTDIECLAQRDTPSERKILLDGRVPDDHLRIAGEHRLVAQLSQNMNFVMDLTVKEFIFLHAESRLVKDKTGVADRVYRAAVQLAGEPFDFETPVTALSGGQSRALMIADVAYLSASPIVLIDEIENAGVDRRQALNLLVGQSKIVIMATHDPLLALSGHHRIVIKNGAVCAVWQTTAEEKSILNELDTIDRRMTRLRHRIRMGEKITHLDQF